MKNVSRKIRHYWWLMASFFKKNARALVVSVIVSFLLILLLVNSLPFINDLFFRKRETIGIVGNYDVNSLPSDILQNVSNSLLTVDETGNLQPVLADSWEVLDENKVYKVYLKKNLQWNDGSPLVASEIQLNLEGVEAEAIDDLTLQFTLSQPLSVFPVYLTKPILKDRLVGVAGTYHIQNVRSNRSGHIELLSLYPNKQDIPYLEYKFYDSEDSLITAYKKGEINLIKTPKKSVADLFEDWNNTSIAREVNYSQVLTVFFNTDSPLLSEKDVRKAIALATPKYDEQGVPASGPIPPYSWAFNDGLKSTPHNVNQARSLIDNYVDASGSAELDLYTFYDYINVAEQMKQSYEEAGLTINLRVLSYVPDNFDILVSMWSPPQDPDQYYFWHSTQKKDNITRYKNVRVDKLLEEGRKVMNTSERTQIYSDFQRLLVDDVPAYFVYHPYVYTISRK